MSNCPAWMSAASYEELRRDASAGLHNAPMTLHAPVNRTDQLIYLVDEVRRGRRPPTPVVNAYRVLSAVHGVPVWGWDLLRELWRSSRGMPPATLAFAIVLLAKSEAERRYYTLYEAAELAAASPVEVDEVAAHRLYQRLIQRRHGLGELVRYREATVATYASRVHAVLRGLGAAVPLRTFVEISLRVYRECRSSGKRLRAFPCIAAALYAPGHSLDAETRGFCYKTLYHATTSNRPIYDAAARAAVATGGDAAAGVGGLPPLHRAALEYKRYWYAKVLFHALLEAGADPDARDVHGRTPLYYAKRARARAAVKALEAASVKRRARRV